MVNKRFQSRYKAENSLSYRTAEAAKVRERHPDRLPIICEKVQGSSISDLSKNKFLAPADLTVGQFMLVLRKRVELEPEQAVFLFIGDVIPANTAHINELYAKHKDEDGFLYLTYSGENSFGS